MPTGYTAAIHDGKDPSFEHFVWTCARAFGALILMRDDPNDAPIPERFEPSDYHAKALLDAEERMIDLRAMTPEQMAEAYMQERAEILAKRAKDVRKRRDLRERYEAMLAQVEAWEPPSSDHVGLKDFMAEQLRSSIEFDCSGPAYPDMPPEDPAAWWDAKIAKAQWDIDYHRKAQAEEVERAEGRNRWITALRDSVSTKASA